MRVAVPMVKVWIVWMPMHHRRMPMPVRVRFAGRITRAMRMLVMLVMHVAMLMLNRFVSMLMVVPFGEVKIEPDRHQHGSTEELDGDLSEWLSRFGSNRRPACPP
jgi:hypothetical protein